MIPPELERIRTKFESAQIRTPNSTLTVFAVFAPHPIPPPLNGAQVHMYRLHVPTAMHDTTAHARARVSHGCSAPQPMQKGGHQAAQAVRVACPRDASTRYTHAAVHCSLRGGNQNARSARSVVTAPPIIFLCSTHEANTKAKVTAVLCRAQPTQPGRAVPGLAARCRGARCHPGPENGGVL